MSYARFGWGDSDVYVFLSCDGALECCGCALSNPGAVDYSPRFKTTAALFAHLTAHVAAGHEVPDSCWEELWADRVENDTWIAAGAPEGWSH